MPNLPEEGTGWLESSLPHQPINVPHNRKRKYLKSWMRLCKKLENNQVEKIINKYSKK